jgi:alpha-mannosidase
MRSHFFKKIFQILLILFLLFISFRAYSEEQDPLKTPPALKNPREYTAYLIGHAHIDLSWLWRWEETVHDIATHTFLGTLAEMDKMPGLTFAQSQAAIYDAIEKKYPSLFEMITRKIKEGTWVPVGGMWVEPDLNMPDGESLARQFLYGKRYFLEKFGMDVKVGWNPDSFGHNWQLPQILRKSGISYYVFERCAPPPEPTPVFWWEGKDGSKVLAYVPPGWYNVELKSGLSEIFSQATKNTALKDFMILYGEGDHGGGPRNSDVEAIKKFKKDKAQPKMEFVVPEDYFKKIEASKIQIPAVKRELNFTFPACYTTQAGTKKNNRKSENLLLTAEKFSALAATSGYRDYYPERDLDESWKIVLRNQFHDILDGSSIGPVYDEGREFYKEVFERGKRALDFSLESITSMIDTRGEGIPLVVYNQLFWERTEPVASEVSLLQDSPSASIKVLDSSSAEIPVQIIEKRGDGDRNFYRFVFMAENIPSFGYKVFRIASTESTPEFKTSLSVSASGLENEFFRVTIDPYTGWIKSIFDKTNGREVLAGEGNVLQAIEDEPESMSAWELGLKDTLAKIGESGAAMGIIETGPVRATVRVKNIFRDSEFQQDIVLYNKFPRIDCQMNFNWQERKLMIKAAFPVNVKAETAEYEIPFGSVTRPSDGTEVPALKWIDVSDASGDYGVSLLNDCKYGFDVKGNTMRISIIHGATAPDPEADRGSHELFYSLYPHRGTWKEANTIRRGYELNNPFLARVGMIHAGTLPAVHSFIQVEPENVIVSSFKKEMGYYDHGVILRLYESLGKKTEAKINFPWSVDVYETDLIERQSKKIEQAGKTVLLTVEPYEIKTIKVVRKSEN